MLITWIQVIATRIQCTGNQSGLPKKEHFRSSGNLSCSFQDELKYI